MTLDPQARWDARYRDSSRPAAPARVLVEHAHLLPASGRALELACGLGANALFLAERGLRVSAWDLSPVAIERLAGQASARGLALSAEVRDVLAEPPPAGAFEVVVVTRFLERGLTPAIAAALRPGGLLYYQTFTRTRVDDTGPGSDAYRLADNELLRLFAGLRVLAYREEGRVGNLTRGLRNEAYLVAQRPEPVPAAP